MPDPSRHSVPPRDWQQAFAALPPESPPAGGWQALAVKLDAPRRARWPLWMASAAVLALAVAVPWRLQGPGPGVDAPAPATTAAPAAADPLEQLYAESAQLESLLAVARDERVSSATAALLADRFEDQLAAIDAALMQPGLSREAQLALWQRRVESLRDLTGFESNRRWLAAHGTRYDAALVAVD
ncbi:hypothetical protein [Luteimonas saliphila]|uniref:hypothetical protein n=1 Tax=Luteimonas saliphila TaxID=2804919 RepID=UPI00192DFD95|nr:hypothetical protein [Luteimonas saliphila]